MIRYDIICMHVMHSYVLKQKQGNMGTNHPRCQQKRLRPLAMRATICTASYCIVYSPRCKISLAAVFVQHVSESLEKTESSCGIKDLTQDTSRQAVVDAHQSLLLDHASEGKGLASGRCQVGPNGNGIEGMDDAPSQAPADAGGRKNGRLGKGVGSSR